MRLAGKTALVTGAQQGIGRAIALAFACEGADIAINWLDDESAANELADAVRALGRRAALIRADVGQFEAGPEMVARTEGELGGIDILVNNAAVFRGSI